MCQSSKTANRLITLKILDLILCYFSSKLMSPLFLQTSGRKGPNKVPNGPYIKMLQTIVKNVCLSVISAFCLLSVICSAYVAYTSLCIGLKYLLKVQYIILTWLDF